MKREPPSTSSENFSGGSSSLRCSCGAFLSPSEKFCASCGSPVKTAPVPLQAAAAGPISRKGGGWFLGLLLLLALGLYLVQEPLLKWARGGAATTGPSSGSVLSSDPVHFSAMRFGFVPHFADLRLAPEIVLREAGLQVRSASGALSIVGATPNMAVGNGRGAVLLMAGGPVTYLELGLARPARQIFLERIGTRNGASVPTWRFEALDQSGRVLDSFDEQHGLPTTALRIELHGQGIVAMRLSTDNRFGAGTWATWNCLPVSELSWEE